MRIGLIGAGRIGTTHASVLASIEDIDTLLIADAEPTRAELLADSLQRASTVPVEAIPGMVDALVIASSTDSHAELLAVAAATGVPAFCEKPIALDLDSTRHVVNAIDAAGVTVQIGFQRRYDPAMRSIRDRIASGDLGTPYLVRSQTHDPAPPPIEYIPVSGGIFRDCLIHDIDIVRYVTGQEVIAVQAAGSVLAFPEIGEHGDVDTASALLTLSAGTLAQLSGLRHDPVGYDVRLEVFAPGGSVAAGWSDRTPIESVDPGAIPPQDPIADMWDRFDAAYRAELEAFVKVVRGEETPASTHHDAYEDLRVAVACDLALAERRTVLMEEIR